jgi:hydrogenase/urease accessory protein HupE
LPAECRALEVPRREIRGNEAVEERWTVDCTDLAGRTIAIAGLDGAGINVVLRIEQADGRVVGGIIEAREPRFEVPAAVAPLAQFKGYFSLGVGHLLDGLDHVLFVLGLLLLVRGAHALVLTVTAFTLGHSLTLAAATLGWIRVNPALTELGIALSLIAVALAVLQPASAPSLLRRHPAGATLAFGLLHGLGFAGALSQAGLPAREIPLSLLAFNLGIEAGQLLLVVVALSGAALWERLQPRPLPQATVPAYIIGSLAACWCIERSLVLLG